ncbi:MAG: hypothetical protein M3P18_01035 [Actinomycetota bacterium]|nr:hypothetical protein [Actinomycetota bacterium]
MSFTTTSLWDQSGRIRNTLEALAGEAVRVLVSASQPLDIGPIPDKAAIRPFVPHQKVLPFAAVTVTHAGHGTVAASLAHLDEHLRSRARWDPLQPPSGIRVP